MALSLDQIDDLQSSNKKQSWTDDIGGREIPTNIFNVLGCHCTSENK